MDVNGTIVRRAADQVACTMGEELVVLDLKSGTYHGLDVVAARIWNLIEHPSSVTAIRDAIIADYDVDAQTCEQDLVAFLDDMRQAGLVEITSD